MQIFGIVKSDYNRNKVKIPIFDKNKLKISFFLCIVKSDYNRNKQKMLIFDKNKQKISFFLCIVKSDCYKNKLIRDILSQTKEEPEIAQWFHGQFKCKKVNYKTVHRLKQKILVLSMRDTIDF
jgi:hypothetical protein